VKDAITAPDVPVRLQADLARLTQDALDALAIVDRLVDEGGPLCHMVNYLANDDDGGPRYLDYQQRSGYRAFADVCGLIVDRLGGSVLAGENPFFSVSGLADAEATVAELRLARTEAAR
jgi:hypothetical protein